MLASSFTAEEAARHLRATEKRITELEAELAQLRGLNRCRAFLHEELASAYKIANELRNYEPDESRIGYLGNVAGAKGGLS